MSWLYASRIERGRTFPGAQIQRRGMTIVDNDGEIARDPNMTPEGDHHFQQFRQVIKEHVADGFVVKAIYDRMTTWIGIHPRSRTECAAEKFEFRHCGLVVSTPAWDGTGCEFDSWQCRIYIPCSLSLRLLGSLRGSLGTYGLTQKLC